MPSDFLYSLAQLALSVSGQVVVLVVLGVGAALVLAQSQALLVLATLGSYLATGVLLASRAAPEMAAVVVMVGIFVSLVMQFTAAERRTLGPAIPAGTTLSFRLVVVVLAAWVAWSLGATASPLDASRFTSIWLIITVAVALVTATDAFKVGVALLVLLAVALLYFAGSTDEASLLVMGLVAGGAFAVALASSHLALAFRDDESP